MRSPVSPRLVSSALVACLASSASAAPADAPLVRVHAVLPRLQDVAPDLALTGSIQARIQSNIAFRVNGKVTARNVEVGQHVRADTVLATLDPVEQQADVNSAAASLAASQAQLQQAQLTFDRQKSLLSSGYTTRASFDQAQAALETAAAQVKGAEAALNTVQEQQSYTALTAGQDGIIVSRDVEAGQVVQAGQTVFVLAQDGPRDAVFDIPETLLTRPPKDGTIDVALQADPSVRTTGTVREISPILDPATSTVTVKIGLAGTPVRMTLGASVVGRARWDQKPAYQLPWSALFEANGAPSVWVLDREDRVGLKPVTVRSYLTGSVLLAEGLDGDSRVVTAGVQLLYPGQKVAVAEGTTP